jgi:2-amino-4-hydroxy-6-hydroxymethyldihydropteridine diphosphokinase
VTESRSLAPKATGSRSAVLSIGSNLGDREALLRAAVADIAALDGVVVIAASRLVETAALKPHGVDTSAPSYLNAAVMVRTTLDPEALLDSLNAIEARHGRVREEAWGNRTLDIDIVTVDDIVQTTDRLILPHPRAAERSFVLIPWLDIDPDATLPGIGRVDSLPAASASDAQPVHAEALL